MVKGKEQGRGGGEEEGRRRGGGGGGQGQGCRMSIMTFAVFLVEHSSVVVNRIIIYEPWNSGLDLDFEFDYLNRLDSWFFVLLKTRRWGEHMHVAAGTRPPPLVGTPHRDLRGEVRVGRPFGARRLAL
jgi:hypothetical protein